MIHKAGKQSTTRRRRESNRGRPVPPRDPVLTRFLAIALGLLLIAGIIGVYQRTWNAGFVWDDDMYVTANKLLSAPDGLKRIWFSLESPSQYFPLTYTLLRVEHSLWGVNPAGYHWVNILLHATNALLVWRLLQMLKVPGAWLAAAFFSFHPVHVESVAWISELKNVLMTFFFLLALVCWVRFLSDSAKWRWYALALLFYSLALTSKTTACTMPAALLLISWLKHEPITWRRLTTIAPFVVLGIGMGLITVWWERYHQGTEGTPFAIGLPERFLIASRAMWFYGGKLVWPAHLSFSYPRWDISLKDAAVYIWPVACMALAGVVLLIRRRTGRGLEVALLFFVATVIPVSGFIMLYTFRYSFVADHYQYLASVGLLALFAAGITKTFDLWGGRLRMLKPILCLMVLLGLGFRSWQQAGTYSDLETLWRSTIEENPDSWMAQNNLGALLLASGRVEEAIPHYEKALELDPAVGETHFNLGNALARVGRTDDAIEHYQRALELEPRLAGPHADLGSILLDRGQISEAIIHFRQALELNPDVAQAHFGLGKALRQMGMEDEAVSHLQKAIQIDPRLAEHL